LPLRLLPDPLKLSLFARYYRPRREQWQSLYEQAPLRFAPGASMGSLKPGDVISDYIAFTGIYELEVSRRAVGLARRGGLMLDVGANLGYFTLLWATARPDNRVIAFEASPRNVPALRHNVERNRCARQVEIAALAVGRNNGTLQFDQGPEEQTGWGGFSTGAASGGISVEVVRVDEFVRDVEEIALLKIDIEGADTWALMGCERLLREQRVQEIWFEEHRPRMRELGIEEGEAQRFLRSLGYVVEPAGRLSAQVSEWRARLGAA
jgi:FkbM family methyltransferase